MGGGIPAQLASHSFHGATNNIISRKRTKDAPEGMADSKTRAGEDETISLCCKARKCTETDGEGAEGHKNQLEGQI